MKASEKLKVATVSSIRPETNYSVYLIDALQKNYSNQIEVYSYCENEEANREVALTNKRYCWDRNWRYFFQILAQARRDRIDLLHFQHEINMFGGPRTAVIFPFLVLAARLLGFKTMVTIHAAVPRQDLNEEFLKVFEWPRPRLLTPVVNFVFTFIYAAIGLFSQRLIVHSPGLRQILVRDYFYSPSKIEVVAHGVPEDISYPLSAVGSQLRKTTEGKKFLLYFGYFHRRKGLEILLRAFLKISRNHPDLFLVLAGGAAMEHYFQALKRLSEELRIADRVLFTGFLALNDLRYLLANCEFVVLPAVYSIAASGPLAQVFAHGKAAIVSDLGVYREEIQNGVNGLLAKVGDDEDLALQIESLLTDQDLKQTIERKAKELGEERAWSKIAGQTLEIYKKLLK